MKVVIFTVLSPQMAKVSQKELESDLEGFLSSNEPKVELEQYQTPPSLAAAILNFINISDKKPGIKGRNILDLGCGCGILGFGCVRLQANLVIGIDIDESAIALAIENREDIGVSPDVISFIEKDVSNLSRDDLPPNIDFDMVIMNPPFGTKHQEKADTMFVEKGLRLTNVVYSIHKSSTRLYLTRTVPKLLKEKYGWDVVADVMLEDLGFKIPRTLKFHKLKEQYVQVDLIKFTRSI